MPVCHPGTASANSLVAPASTRRSFAPGSAALRPDEASKQKELPLFSDRDERRVREWWSTSRVGSRRPRRRGLPRGGRARRGSGRAIAVRCPPRVQRDRRPRRIRSPPRRPRPRGGAAGRRPADAARDRRRLGARRCVGRAGAFRQRASPRPPARTRARLGSGVRAARAARGSSRGATRPGPDRLRPRSPRPWLARDAPRRRHAARHTA